MLRAFEKYGTALTLDELAKQWVLNSTGTFASAEQARLKLERGITPPNCGHPRYNRL